LLLQACAAVLALRLIRLMGRWTPWALLAAAIVLMTVRRGITLWHVWDGDPAADLPAELVALTISILMLGGVTLIGPVIRNLETAAAASRRSAERLHRVTEAMPGLVGYVNQQLAYEFANGRFAEWTKYSADDAIGRTIAEVHGEELYAQVKDRLEATLRGEAQIFQVTRFEGTPRERHVQVIYAPDEQPDGRVAGIYLYVIDVTELRKTERALRRTQQILSKHIANTPLAVIEWDDEFRFVRWSGRAEEIFGWSPDEILGKSWKDLRFVHDDDAERVGVIAQRLVDGEEQRNVCINRNYTKTGEVVHCEWHNSVLRDGDGKIISFLSLTKDMTDRTRAEQSLRESEERLRLALTGIHGGAWDWNVQTGEVYRSDEWLETFGFTRQDAEPDSGFWERHVHPDDRPALEALLADIEQPGYDEYRFEYRLRAGDGAYRWVLDNGVVVERTEAGRPRRALGIDFDITDRRLAEEALRESEQRLELAIEGGDLGVWDWHLPSDRVVIGERYERMLGLEPGTIGSTGNDFLEYLHPEDLDRVRAAMNAHLRGETPMLDVEYRMRTGAGGWKWVHDRARVTERDGDGSPIRVTGVHLDIDDRKRAERSLQLYRQAVESSRDSIAVADLDYVCLFANESYLAQRDLSRKQIEGHHLGDYLGKDFFQRVVKPRYDRCLAGESLAYDIAQENPSGEVRHNLVSYSPLRDDQQRVSGVVTIVRDITDLKRTEHRQRLLLRELEHRVKNNLAGLHGLINQYRDAPISKDKLAEAIGNRLRAMHTVHQLMVNDRDLLVDMRTLPLQLLAEFASGDGHAVQSRFSAEGPPLKVNSRQSTPLAMIYQELLTNAAKYGALSSPTGQVDVTWTPQPPTPDGLPVTLRWRERGGPAVQPPQGDGLGLDLVAGFAEFELGGSAVFRFDPAGFECDLHCMLDLDEPPISDRGT
jgi:PAS domain S-box-containing protein